MKNNKNRKELVTMAVLTIVISAGVTTAFAHQGNGNRAQLDPEFKENVETAIENNDYQAWSSLHSEGDRMTEVITEDNFGQLIAMHNAMEDGDSETAQSIREELGLQNQRKFKNKGQDEYKQRNIHLILEGDYDKWIAALPEDAPIKSVVTAENFDQWVLMHQAMEDNDWETVKTIKDGFNWSDMENKKSMHQGMRKGIRHNK